MIAGEVDVFFRDKEDAELSQSALFEVDAWECDPFVELAVDIGNRRVYFRFRVDDLLREINEAKQA